MCIIYWFIHVFIRVFFYLFSRVRFVSGSFGQVVSEEVRLCLSAPSDYGGRANDALEGLEGRAGSGSGFGIWGVGSKGSG